MQIFNIFKNSKRVLLFLIENGILIMDEIIAKKIVTTPNLIKCKYPQYFAPEIKQFIDKPWFTEIQKKYDNTNWIKAIKEDLPDNFFENRKIGENNDIICKLIREDRIKDFIVHFNKTNFLLNSLIEPSIYETNSFLLLNQLDDDDDDDENENEEEDYYDDDEFEIELIEYAVFYGSIQIFKYLQTNEVKLTRSLWHYVVHSQNPEIIHILEDNHFKPTKEDLKESIKCHSNDTATYLLYNYPNLEVDIVNDSIKYYNFNFLQNIDGSLFYLYCKHEYYSFVEYILKNKLIDINESKVIKKNDTEISKTPLIEAVEKGYIELVKLLLQNDNIDVNYKRKENRYDDDDEIHEDIEDPWEGKDTKIGDYDADKSCCKCMSIEITKSSLIIAIEHENIEIIKLLLNSKNIDLNSNYCLDIYLEFDGTPHDPLIKRKSETKSALFIAVEKENIEIIKLLNNCHDDLYKKTINWSVEDYYRFDMWKENKEMSSSKTALCLAIEKNNFEIVKILLQNKNIDVNKKSDCNKKWHFKMDDWNANTFDGERYVEDKDEYIEKAPLILAIEKDNFEIVNLLLQNENIDNNIKCAFNSNWTKEPIVNNIRKSESHENTALDIANKIGNAKIINLLKKT